MADKGELEVYWDQEVHKLKEKSKLTNKLLIDEKKTSAHFKKVYMKQEIIIDKLNSKLAKKEREIIEIHNEYRKKYLYIRSLVGCLILSTSMYLAYSNNGVTNATYIFWLIVTLITFNPMFSSTIINGVVELMRRFWK